MEAKLNALMERVAIKNNVRVLQEVQHLGSQNSFWV